MMKHGFIIFVDQKCLLFKMRYSTIEIFNYFYVKVSQQDCSAALEHIYQIVFLNNQAHLSLYQGMYELL